VARNLGDGSDETSAIVPQIQNKPAGVLGVLHGGFEILFDLGPESGNLYVADFMRQIPGDHAPLEFDKTADQRYRAQIALVVNKSHRDGGVARPVEKFIVGLQFQRRLSRAFNQLVTYAFERLFNRRPIDSRNGEAGAYALAGGLRTGIN